MSNVQAKKEKKKLNNNPDEKYRETLWVRKLLSQSNKYLQLLEWIALSWESFQTGK